MGLMPDAGGVGAFSVDVLRAPVFFVAGPARVISIESALSESAARSVRRLRL